jgi:signal transduction histidine kinase
LAISERSHPTALHAQGESRARRLIERIVRFLPIRWRIFSIAALNTAVVVVIAALIWDGAKVLGEAWDEVRQVRESDDLLALLGGEASRLQDLIHRYINQPNAEIFGEILLRREALLSTLSARGSADPMLAASVGRLTEVTEQFLAGFNDLRAAQATITSTYEKEILKPSKDMASLYGLIEAATVNRDELIWPALGKSHEAFTATLLAANVYYFSLAAEAAAEASRKLDLIAQTIPVLVDLASSDLQRDALRVLRERTDTVRQGLAQLIDKFATRDRLLRDEIDGSQAAMIGIIDDLSGQMRQREVNAQERFDKALADVYRKVAFVALMFLGVIVLIGTAVARSISVPLHELRDAMYANISGDDERRVEGTEARDEIGEMARAVEVFRENAIAKRRAEDELRASKKVAEGARDRAERALADLRDAQRSLIEAEKLAALGSLVAGVAHEVNNPVGISLTVASSFARRCEVFAKEVRDGALRRSRLDEFIEGSRDAAHQLVANLQRAGELIQSFKQVAVDRSHAERRTFDLRESTEQIVVSLRPGLKSKPLTLAVEIPDNVTMDSYPGPYGQVLTNLVLNAVVHGFADGRSGTIIVRARQVDAHHVELTFVDDGAGMSEDVQRRVFDPFFTTRRTQGGTGLGLHIVYNLVTRQLGGRITLTSAPGRGTTFRITLPLTAPREAPREAPADNPPTNQMTSL